MDKLEYKVERRTSELNSWYEVMLSPFKTFEDCSEYIETFRHYYPLDQQNYKVTTKIKKLTSY
jgi:hypothetical protein